jgi:pilus assembly protein FimV
LEHRSTNATRFALTAVALAAAGLWAQPAAALGLGRLTVQSALGESLRAEIEVTSITPEEAASLNLRIAPPAAYRAAGIEYNAALPSATVQIVKRADGRSVLRLVSDRAVLEPFVDVIVEANWSSGRLVREYTMLFDPPSNRLAVAPAPVVPPVAGPAPAPAPAAAAPAPVSAAPSPPPPPAPMTRPATPPRAKALAATTAAPTPATPAPAFGADTYQVKPGESLSRVAARTQRPGVSLDQMLVSLFRGNPQAFIAENINKLKAGAVLTVPSAEQAAQIAQAEAREIIIAQSTDFGVYRQKLAAGAAAGAGAAPAVQPARQAKGQVQAQVDDRKAGAAAAPDRLTLSQGNTKPAAAPVDKKDDQARLAELNRNVEDLKKLQGATATAPASSQPTAPAAAVVASAPVETRNVAAASAAPASAPAAGPKVTRPLPEPSPAPAAEGPGLLDSVLENPFLLPGAAVLVVLLAGLGLYKLRGRKRKPAGETSFLESRLQPDSFFGASGGQRVDTRDASPPSQSGNSSSINYSMSQLDAIGDVDPVAEADVYLAYGRDLQAEEILKEAMRAAPERLAVRTKLLEVYAKRRDTKAFELLATQLFNLTGGKGEDWAKAQSMGLAIDPDNALYRPGGAPEGAQAGGPPGTDALGASTQPYTELPPEPAFEPASDAMLDAGLDLDLDLDLDLAPEEPAAPPPNAAEATQPYPQPNLMRLDGNVDEVPKTVSMPRPRANAPALAENLLDFDLGELPEQPHTITLRPPASTGTTDFGDFDLGDAPTMPLESSALSRKLELAEEFRQIGDVEGARDLLEEVLAKSEGALKNKAQGMLDQLARR